MSVTLTTVTVMTIDDNSRPRIHAVFTAEGIEVAQSEDELPGFGVQDGAVPIQLMLNAGATNFFWSTEGGNATYKINDNATLTIFRNDDVHTVFGPSAWLLVRGPEKKARAGLLN